MTHILIFLTLIHLRNRIWHYEEDYVQSSTTIPGATSLNMTTASIVTLSKMTLNLKIKNATLSITIKSALNVTAC